MCLGVLTFDSCLCMLTTQLAICCFFPAAGYTYRTAGVKVSHRHTKVENSPSIYLSIPYSWGPLGHHTTWQPTFAIPPSPLVFPWCRSVPNLSNPGCHLPIALSVCLSLSLPIQCPGGLSWQVAEALVRCPYHFILRLLQ